jgi:hypothetical protein
MDVPLWHCLWRFLAGLLRMGATGDGAGESRDLQLANDAQRLGEQKIPGTLGTSESLRHGRTGRYRSRAPSVRGRAGFDQRLAVLVQEPIWDDRRLKPKPDWR